VKLELEPWMKPSQRGPEKVSPTRYYSILQSTIEVRDCMSPFDMSTLPAALETARGGCGVYVRAGEVGGGQPSGSY
jgi:hypothetical protein